MKWFSDLPAIYLHREYVDFRKAVNGLCLIVEQELSLNPYDASLYVFCNRSRDKLKILHWDETGFVLWYKRLEKDQFKWPRDELGSVIELTEQSLNWLLTGLPIRPLEPHKALFYQPLSKASN